MSLSLKNLEIHNRKDQDNKLYSKNGFNSALLLEVQHFNSSPNSPKQNLNNNDNQWEMSPVQNFLPFDLLNRIDSISSPMENGESSKISDISLKSDNKSNEEEEILLNQDENLQFSNIETKNYLNINQSKSSSESEKVEQFQNEQYCNQFTQMQLMNNFYNSNVKGERKLSQQNEPNWNIILNSGNNNANIQHIPRKATNEISDYKGRKIENKYYSENSNDVNILDQQYNNLNEFNKKQKKRKESDDFIIEMFGRRGWVCMHCNNFNYESRSRCNRCGIPKQPKKVFKKSKDIIGSKNGEIANDEIVQLKKTEIRTNWVCSFCNNLNFAFRKVCNRCQISKESINEEVYDVNNMNAN